MHPGAHTGRVVALASAVSWPLARPCRGPWLGRVVARAGRVAGSRLPCCSPRSRVLRFAAHHAARLPSTPPARLTCRIVALATVSWVLAARQPGYIAGPVPRAGLPCPRLSRDTVQPHAPQPQSRYTPVYRETPPPAAKLPPSLPLCHNTISVL